MIPTRQTRNSEGKIGYSRLPVRQCLFLPIRPVHAAEYLDATEYSRVSAAAEYLAAAEYSAAADTRVYPEPCEACRTNTSIVLAEYIRIMRTR